MKTLAILAACLLSSCVTTTETRPDGTIVKTEAIDQGTVTAAQALAILLADRNSGK